MKTPHKHAELIKAWADGHEIEYLSALDRCWTSIPSPTWDRSIKYRVKPEPAPDVVEWHNVVRSGCTPTDKPNIKLTFDGETGKLKSAEVIL